MTIRPITPRDLEAVQQLAAATPEAPQWTRAAYEQFLPETNPNHRIFLAEIDQIPTGFIAGQIAVDACELESIAVAAAFRRRGIAATLLATLADWAQKQGALRVQLEVRAGNASAIAFYLNHGFQKDSLRRRYYHHPDEDAVLMSLPLAP